jgi:micrococcal nuclease
VGARRGGGLLILVIVAIVVLLTDQNDRRSAPDSGAREGDGRESAGGEVSRVIDGDTIEVELDAGIGGGPALEDVRYIGIDTPESVKPGTPVQCYGKEASEFNGKLVEGRRVVLRFDSELRDRFGRLLAYVYVGETFVNAELVRLGYARTLEIEPNTANAGRFASLEENAGEAGLGLWSAC